jgi:hypothetical protein
MILISPLGETIVGSAMSTDILVALYPAGSVVPCPTPLALVPAPTTRFPLES